MKINGWLKKSSGSAINLTFAEVRGVTTARGKSLGPTNEPTPIQVGNRRTFATLVAISEIILAIITVGFSQQKKPTKPGRAAQTLLNAFDGENRKYANDVFDYTVPDDPTFDPANLAVAKGTLSNTAIATATGDISDNACIITWDPTAISGFQTAFDMAWVAIYNVTQDRWLLFQSVAVRSDGSTGSMVTTGFIVTDVVYGYLFFQGIDAVTLLPNGKVSDSRSSVITLVA